MLANEPLFPYVTLLWKYYPAKKCVSFVHCTFLACAAIANIIDFICLVYHFSFSHLKGVRLGKQKEKEV
jgi:lipoprotein signal peptidase